MLVESAISCRTPLLWFLLPFILGISLFDRIVVFSTLPCLLLGVLFLCLLFLIKNKALSLLFFLFASIFFGANYWRMKKDVYPSEWKDLPARELKLKIRVKHLYASPNQYGKYSGEAVIVDCDPLFHDLRSYKLVYSLSLKEGLSPPVRSAEYWVKGCFDSLPSADFASPFERYAQRKAIYFRLNQGYLLEQAEVANCFYSLCDFLSLRSESILRHGLEEKETESAMYTAILLGRRKCLSDEQKQLFLSTGIMHLFSVSGLHVVAAAGVLLAGAKTLRIPYRFRDLPVLLILFLYVQLSGASPASVRAFSMVFIYLLMRICRRKPEAFPALVLSSVFVLFIEPWQIWNAGFQLSYTVASGILLFGIPLNRDLKPVFSLNRLLLVRRSNRLFQKMIDCILALLCVSLGASLLSLPLAIQHFSTFTPGGILLNISLVPFASFVVSVGLFSLLCGFIGLDFISGFLNQFAAYLVHLIELQAEWAQSCSYLFYSVDSVPFDHFGLSLCVFLLFFVLLSYRPLSEGRFWPYYTAYILLFISCCFLDLK